MRGREPSLGKGWERGGGPSSTGGPAWALVGWLGGNRTLNGPLARPSVLPIRR